MLEFRNELEPSALGASILVCLREATITPRRFQGRPANSVVLHAAAPPYLYQRLGSTIITHEYVK